MTGRGAIAVIGPACGASLGLFPGWAAAEPPRQTAKVAFTTTTPGAPTGLSTSVDWTNPSDRTAKPYAVDKVIFRYARGISIDYAVPDQCKASDAQLEADGA